MSTENEGVNSAALGGLDDIGDADVPDIRVPTPAVPPVTVENVQPAAEPAPAPASAPMDIGALVAAEVAKALAAHQDPKVAELQETIKRLEAEKAEMQAKRDAEQLLDQHNRPGVANESRASSLTRYAIVLEEARDANEVNPVPVSVNGRAYQLKRGVRLEVPAEVVNVLNDAVTERSIAVVGEGDILSGITTRKARRFPFMLIGKAVDETGKRLLPETEELPNGVLR